MLKDEIDILKSEFDRDTKVSHVVINSDYGIFEGYAKMHPEDAAYESQFLGCYIAQAKAEIKFLRAKRDSIKRRIATLKTFGSIQSVKKLEKKLVKVKEEIAACDKFINHGDEKFFQQSEDYAKKVKKAMLNKHLNDVAMGKDKE